jgi:vancomycin resistance protein YoaR
MRDAEIDLVEQALNQDQRDPAETPAPADPPASTHAPASDWMSGASPAASDPPSDGPRWLADPSLAPSRPLPALRARRPEIAAQARLAAAMALTFAVGAVAVLFLFLAVATAVAFANSGRAMPGVRVGSVDVSGLTRSEIVARLSASYAYLSQGDVEITTPTGTTSISYRSVGRAPDVEYMADAAMRAGRTGNVLGDAVTIWRSAVGGQTVPVAVRVDPSLVATQVRQLYLTRVLAPRDAQADLFYGSFIYYPAANGSAIDEDTVGSSIVGHLSEPNTPSEFQIGEALLTLKPTVSDDDAKAAIEAANRMAVDVTLTFGGDGSPAASASGSPLPSKTYTIPGALVREWIVFGLDADGNYGPSVDFGRAQAYISSLPGIVLTAPVEPRVTFDASGAPTGLTGGADGLGVDAGKTASVLETYLLGLGAGTGQQHDVQLILGAIPPRVNVGNLSELTIMGGGDASWTTIFYPGETNGNGANIRTPAALLNGQIVAPGQQFSFFRAVSPIDEAHGYTWGGVILHGKSDHTGAMGGGICSASTTMFNAALRAGLQIDERHAHAYYIDRYPAGLDATVFSNGSQVYDLRWTNDTPNPIVIRSWATNRSKSAITIQLWSLPIDRTVVLNPIAKANIVKAGDSTEYVTTLPPGVKNRAEYPTDGFDIVRTRTVTDESGQILHFDTWNSRYRKVDGLLQIGAAASTPTPEPTPSVLFAPLALAILKVASGATRPRRGS